MRDKKKRSAAITLVLAGSLAGCGEPEPQRDVYRSLAECQRDWPGASDCRAVDDNRYSRGSYYGPHYYGSSYTNGTPRPSRNAMEATRSARGASVTRGGFGSSSHSFSSGS